MVELALPVGVLLIAACGLGSGLGFALRRLTAGKPARVSAPPAVAPPAAPVVITPVPVPLPAPQSHLPRGIAGPRAGQPDDFRRISGIGPRVERWLHDFGIYHYDQIARWSVEQAEAVSLQLGFPGRVAREQWVAQALVLSRGAPVGVAAARPRTKPARRRMG